VDGYPRYDVYWFWFSYGIFKNPLLVFDWFQLFDSRLVDLVRHRLPRLLGKAIIDGFFEKINLNMVTLINADFCAAAVLISMGAVLGKTTFSQLFLLATFETIFYCLNAVILLQKLHIVDVGGSITIHMFGAYFGLASA